MLGKQDMMLGKQDVMTGLQGKTVGLQERTIEKLDEFHNDTIQRFDVVDAKYGKIAHNLERILEEMKQERREARKSTERIISMIVGMKGGGVIKERKTVYRAGKKIKKAR